MKLIATSVDYADYLERSLPTWLAPAAEALVVTTPTDEATAGVCRRLQVPIFQTTVFHDGGAPFAKASALVAAMEATDWLQPPGWRCLIDADICLPPDWLAAFYATQPQTDFLYGAARFDEAGKQIKVCGMAGYFQIFHSTDRRVQRRPMLSLKWSSAAGYDMEFKWRWRRRKRIWLPLRLTHLGEPRRNWFGRGNPMRWGRLKHRSVP